MSSLLEILQAGSVDESEKVLTTEEKTPEIVEKISAKPSKAGHFATAELVFLFKLPLW